MHLVRRFYPLLALATALLAGCEGEPEAASLAGEPIVSFDTARVCIATATDTLPLTVEVAATDAQRAYGLMERDQLPADAGMLFTYAEPQPPESGFWMFRTRIPLDIAFLGPEGEIRSIQTMQPCTSPDPRWCDAYPAGVEFQAALEVNQGFFAARGIDVGDRVLSESEGECPRAPRR